MALLIGINGADKGSAIAVGLNTEELFQLPSVADNEYFSDPTNVSRVQVIYKSNPGGQKKSLFYDVTIAEPVTFLKFSLRSRDEFLLHSITLYDFDGGFMMVDPDDLPADLNISLSSNSSTRLYMEPNNIFVQSNTDITTDLRITQILALDPNSGLPIYEEVGHTIESQVSGSTSTTSGSVAGALSSADVALRQNVTAGRYLNVKGIKLRLRRSGVPTKPLAFNLVSIPYETSLTSDCTRCGYLSIGLCCHTVLRGPCRTNPNISAPGF